MRFQDIALLKNAKFPYSATKSLIFARNAEIINLALLYTGKMNNHKAQKRSIAALRKAFATQCLFIFTSRKRKFIVLVFLDRKQNI